jgi:hypothetical protein
MAIVGVMPPAGQAFCSQEAEMGLRCAKLSRRAWRQLCERIGAGFDAAYDREALLELLAADSLSNLNARELRLVAPILRLRGVI